MAEFLQTSMAKIKEMVDVNTIVGDPVTTPDGVTLVPVSRVASALAEAAATSSSSAAASPEAAARR